MRLRPSLPTQKRKLLAAGVVLFFGATASLIRLSRADFDLLPILAAWDAGGTSTNFMVCAGGPFIAFFQNDAIDVRYYVKTALATAVGLSLYEVAQIFMPGRTFDLNDILASFCGALLSIMLAVVLFFLRSGNRGNSGREPERQNPSQTHDHL